MGRFAYVPLQVCQFFYMNRTPLHGLIAATYTPLNADGSLKLELIPDLVDELLSQEVRGLYVCGSTGEGMSLTTAERQQVAQAYTDCSRRSLACDRASWSQ